MRRAHPAWRAHSRRRNHPSRRTHSARRTKTGRRTKAGWRASTRWWTAASAVRLGANRLGRQRNSGQQHARCSDRQEEIFALHLFSRD